MVLKSAFPEYVTRCDAFLEQTFNPAGSRLQLIKVSVCWTGHEPWTTWTAALIKAIVLLIVALVLTQTI